MNWFNQLFYKISQCNCGSLNGLTNDPSNSHINRTIEIESRTWITQAIESDQQGGYWSFANNCQSLSAIVAGSIQYYFYRFEDRKLPGSIFNEDIHVRSSIFSCRLPTCGFLCWKIDEMPLINLKCLSCRRSFNERWYFGNHLFWNGFFVLYVTSRNYCINGNITINATAIHWNDFKFL